MTKTLATQAVAAILAATATLAVVIGVDGLAQREYANAQAVAMARADAQVATVQHVTVVGHRVA